MAGQGLPPTRDGKITLALPHSDSERPWAVPDRRATSVDGELEAPLDAALRLSHAAL